MNEISAALPKHLTDRAPEETKAKNTLGKDDFLKLLMAQLNNQDPLKPMEHQEFAAQLAQFGQLEQLQNIHKGIDGLQGGMGNESKLSALGMIGKTVLATGNSVSLIEGEGTALSFNKKEGITPIKATVYSDEGKIVREIELDPRAEANEVKWDGKDQDGKALASGKYTFRVSGVNQSGQAQELDTGLSGRVLGVEMEGANAVLIVQTSQGSSKLEMNRVHSVSLPADEKNPKTEAKAATLGAQPAVMERLLQAPTQVTQRLDNSGGQTQPIDMSELELPEAPAPSGAETVMEAGPRPLEERWQGMPPFASFQDLK